MRFDKILDLVYCLNDITILPQTFFLKNFGKSIQKLVFCKFIASRGEVQGDILIEPDSALAVFPNQNHFVRDVKRSKTVKKTLKSYE